MGDQRIKRPSEHFKATWDTCGSSKTVFSLNSHASVTTQGFFPKKSHQLLLVDFPGAGKLGFNFYKPLRPLASLLGEVTRLSFRSKAPCRALRCEQNQPLPHPTSHSKESTSAPCVWALPNQTSTQNPSGDPSLIPRGACRGPCSNISTVVASCTWAMGAFPCLGSATGLWVHQWAAQHRDEPCCFSQHWLHSAHPHREDTWDVSSGNVDEWADVCWWCPRLVA